MFARGEKNSEISGTPNNRAAYDPIYKNSKNKNSYDE